MNKLQLNETEKGLFTRLASSPDGKILSGFVNKLIDSIVDARTINDEVDLRAAKKAALFLEIEILNNLRTPQGLVSSDQDTYE